MTKLDKLFFALMNKKKEIRYPDLVKVLKTLGYLERQGKGSHVVFSHKKHVTITLPKNNSVKRCYVEQVRAVLEKYLGGEE
ncbi:type II toxin-antitoxin system HicA family toxin [bacterium]|nr:type II toxin-antitoxin system HicA family toxin [bacterium]